MKRRKCPYCKSKKGFSVLIKLGGFEVQYRTFTGKLIDHQREGSDEVSHYVNCLDCGKSFSSDEVKTDQDP